MRPVGCAKHTRVTHTRACAVVEGESDGGLLVAHKSGSVSLDLGLELGRADGLAAGRRPHGLDELGKLWQAANMEVSQGAGG